MTLPGEKTNNPVLPEWSIPVAFHFSVKMGNTQVSFCEVNGIECSLELDEVKSGGDNYNSYYFPKSRKFSDLVLKRGLVKKGDPFYDWCKSILTKSLARASIEPKDIMVSLLDEKNEAIRTWNFVNAYPIKWSLGAFDAMKNELVMESVTLKYYSFSVE